MKHEWEVKRLGEVAEYRKEFITIDDLATYKLCRVQTKVKGVVLREQKSGFEIKTKNQQICQSGDLIFAEMDARFGGFGFIPSELDGAIVSSHYFLYEIKESSIFREFLNYCLQQPWFLAQVEAKGSTNYAAIRPSQVLDYEIPLPPLAEQKRIVAKVESIWQRIGEIRKLRREQEHELATLLFSRYTEAIAAATRRPMREVAPIHRRPVELDLEETYNELGVRSFGRGVFEKPSFEGAELTWQKPYWIKGGDLLLSNIKAWEGAVSLVPDDYDGWVGSHRYITCLPNQELINPVFLDYYFKTQEGVEALSAASPGTADRNRTLNTKMLANIKVPIPALSIQKEFVALIHKVHTIREQYADQEKELSELIPGLLDKAFKGEL